LNPFAQRKKGRLAMEILADEQAFRTIIGLIVEHRLSPGERLYEPELVEMLGMSRTPIRQALGRLMTEGILEKIPGQKGYRIPALTKEDLLQVFVARSTLEGRAAELAAELATEEDIETLLELNHRESDFVELYGNQRKGLFAELNEDFHTRIVRLSGNLYFQRHFSQLYHRSSLYTFYFSPYYILDVNAPEYVARRKDGRYKSSMEHKLIVRALSERDGLMARKHMEEHILNTVKHRLSLGML
jgi:DNA-binding GntR family transcriptional regulator